MQNQHQTFHHLPFFLAAMYSLRDPSLCTFEMSSAIREGEWVFQHRKHPVCRPHHKTENTALRKSEWGKLILSTQSRGLTDEFMCALINWFTQRLSHVDITLVQGLIVDFYYDKLLMEDWVVTAAAAAADSVIDFRSCLFARHTKSVS